MTVCIGAICEEGNRIVVAADRMYTSPPPVNIEFESSVSKLVELDSSALILGSGNLAVITEITQRTMNAMSKAKAGSDFPIVDQIRKDYESVRLEKAFQQIVTPMLGHEFVEFTKKNGTIPTYLATQKEIFQAIIMQQQQFNLNTELLIAVVGNDNSQVAVVTHPAVSYLLDKLGYGSTGSGAIHAISSLNLSGQKRDLSVYDTLYNVYRAKRVSEVAPGVGNATDMAIIQKGKKVHHCGPKILRALNDALDETESKKEINTDSIKDAYDEESES